MKRHTKQRITGLLAVCLTFTAAVYGREGNPAAYRSGDRLCVRLPITAGIDLSVGANATFAACLAGMLVNKGMNNPVLLLVVAIVGGTLIGWINGMLLR